MGVDYELFCVTLCTRSVLLVIHSLGYTLNTFWNSIKILKYLKEGIIAKSSSTTYHGNVSLLQQHLSSQTLHHLVKICKLFKLLEASIHWFLTYLLCFGNGKGWIRTITNLPYTVTHHHRIREAIAIRLHNPAMNRESGYELPGIYDRILKQGEPRYT